MNFCPQCASILKTQLIDEHERLVCTSVECNYVYWNNPIPVVAALVEVDNQFVLARNKAWPEEFYSLITGFMEAYEVPIDSIARETKEELNLDFISGQLLGHYPFAQMNQLIIAYHVKAQGNIKLNEELSDYKLLSLSQLQDYDFGPMKLGAVAVQRIIELSQ